MTNTLDNLQEYTKVTMFLFKVFRIQEFCMFGGGGGEGGRGEGGGGDDFTNNLFGIPIVLSNMLDLSA